MLTTRMSLNGPNPLIMTKDLGYPCPSTCGRVAEWLMAPVLKTGIPETVSGVRIPPLPPLSFRFWFYFCGEMAEWLKAHAWKACIG